MLVLVPTLRAADWVIIRLLGEKTIVIRILYA